jgi:hypothetical protein
MDSDTFRVPTKLIMDFSIVTVRNSVKASPSKMCKSAVNIHVRFFFFNGSRVSLKDIFPLYNSS